MAYTPKEFVDFPGLSHYDTLIKGFIGDVEDIIVETLGESINAKYTKPSGGIPKADLTSTVQDTLDNAASINSPTFTGTPAAPTAAAGTNTTQIATTAFVQNAIGSAIAASY